MSLYRIISVSLALVVLHAWIILLLQGMRIYAWFPRGTTQFIYYTCDLTVDLAWTIQYHGLEKI
ncbi:hypothetical protein WN48_05931 [Eufriesea mexicana]|nr:hypothetical protein WN48_05931 [Eufriesea mexicana]